MPAYKFGGGAQPSVADFAVGGLMTAPIKAAQSVPAAIRAAMQTPDSAQDLLGNPTALQMMERMFQEANPVFKRMQAMGKFGKGAMRTIENPSGDPNFVRQGAGTTRDALMQLMRKAQ